MYINSLLHLLHKWTKFLTSANKFGPLYNQQSFKVYISLRKGHKLEIITGKRQEQEATFEQHDLKTIATLFHEQVKAGQSTPYGVSFTILMT